MVISCVAPNCEERFRKNGPTFHRFPTRKSVLEEWIAAIKIEGFKPDKNSFVCSRHFRAQDYSSGLERNRLRANAVPRLFYSAKPPGAKTAIAKKPKPTRKNKKLSFCVASIALDHPYSICSISDENIECRETFVMRHTAHKKILQAKQTLAKKCRRKRSGSAVINDCDYFCTNGGDGPEMLNPWQSRVIEACFLIPVICDLEVRDDDLYEESGEEILS